MTIKLYKLTCEKIVLDKTDYMATEYVLTGTLREQTSINNPSIIIEYNGYPHSFNYAHIPDFYRYYFINDVTSVGKNLWRLDMHVDVLMSYKDDIEETSAFVDRTERDSDEYLKDANEVPQLGYQSITRSLFSGDSLIPPRDYVKATDGPMFILALNAIEVKISGETIYRKPNGVLYIFCTQDVVNEISSQIAVNSLGFAQISDYIIDSFYLPRKLTSGNELSEIKFLVRTVAGSASVTVNLDPGECYEFNALKTVNTHFYIQEPISEAIDVRHRVKPYIQASVELQPFGTIPIDEDMLIDNDYLHLLIKTDLHNGDSILYMAVSDASDSYINLIQLASANIAMSYPVISTANNAAKAVAGVAGMVTNALTGNVGGAIASGMSLITNVVAGDRVTGAQGSSIIDAKPALIVKRKYNSASPYQYEGRPKFAQGVISNFSGFIRIGGVHIDYDGITSDEADELETIMKGGIIV